MKRKEDGYSHGARLAVVKSNKLERELKDARDLGHNPQG